MWRGSAAIVADPSLRTPAVSSKGLGGDCSPIVLDSSSGRGPETGSPLQARPTEESRYRTSRGSVRAEPSILEPARRALTSS